jgi:hypothetical protein
MLATRRRVSERATKLGSITTIATHLLVAFALAVVVCCLFSTTSLAQGSLSLGTVDTPTTGTCNTSDGWYYYTDPGSTKHYLNCRQTTVRNCQNAADWPLTFGYLNPAGIVPNTAHAIGTIVFFSGDGGGLSVLPGNFGYADAYFKAGYEIVEIAWNDDWEYTYDPYSGSETASVQNAACRPATFMKKYVYDVLFAPSGGGGVLGGDSSAGFCAHGASAGSAAVASSLAYYGAGSWLDNVELISGPVFSDIKQGCMVSTGTPLVNVCPSGQYGCVPGSGSSWSLSPSYLGVGSQVGLWTNDSSCRGSSITSTASNSAWLAQSIVDQSTGATPTFTYSSTAMSAWLCRSVASGYGLPNNSSSQGQIFYANIGSSNSPPLYAVYAVDSCTGAENVGGGNVSGYHTAIFGGTITGANAIVDDMIGYSNGGNVIAPQCVRRTH